MRTLKHLNNAIMRVHTYTKRSQATYAIYYASYTYNNKTLFNNSIVL